MAHKSEHVSTGDGFKVKNDETTSTVITQDGNIQVLAGSSDPTIEGGMTYISGTGYRFKDASGVFTVPRTGGGGGGATLDSAYENGPNVQLDAGTTTWTDSTTGSANGFALVKDGAGSGNLFDISIDAALTGNAIAIDMNLGIAAAGIFIDNGATARTGSDILITDDSTGNHSVIDINSSGNSASIGFDWTGSFAGSPGGSAISLTFDNADNLDTEGVLITRGTGVRTASALSIVDTSTGSDDIINIDVGGVLTGNVIDITTSAAATGNALFINLDSAVAMTALHIEGSGVRTQPYIELITDSTSSASLIDISVDGAITGTAAIDMDMNAGLAANAIFIDAGGGTRTADLIAITDDGDGNVDTLAITASNTGSGSVFDIDVSGIRTGNIIDIAMSGAATSTAVIAIDMDAAVAAAAILLDGGAGTRTADLIDVTMDGDGNVGVLDINVTNTGSGDIIDIDVTGVHTGNIIDIDVSAAAATGNLIDLTTGTNLAGNAIAITTAGVRTSPVILITGAGTDGGTDDHIIDINQSAILDSNILDITYSAAASTGNAIDINMGTNIAGSALDIDASGVRTGPLFNITSDATDGGTDDHTIFITQTGVQDSNMIQLTYGTAASTGNAISIIMDTNLAGSALVVTRTGVVTDDTIKIDSDQTGSTHQFDINLDGAGSGNVLDITYGTAANTGNAIDLNMGTNVAGMAISIASAATGTSGEGSGLDIAHTGDLAAGADVVRINSTGNHSATSNLLAIEQSSGAGLAGTFGLYINTTGTNVEALKVDAGVSFFDEGFQVEAVARTANATAGNGTSTVADGERHVTVTSASANNIMVLPTPTPGYEVYLFVGANGYELRTSAPASVAINGGTGASAESAIPANTLTKCICTSATTWVCQNIDNVGAVSATEVAA